MRPFRRIAFGCHYRNVILALLPFLVVACGDDGGKIGDDATQTDTNEPLDTNPNPDVPGDTSGGNRPPELERIGDRSVAVGQTLSITLTGKDADDDKLTYSVFGNLPEGARFDKGEHRFEWAPTEANKTIFLTFVVSDGTDFDRETVRIQVTATATTNPPTFADVGDQILPVGQAYTLSLIATDPDGDRLTYGHEGSLPTGAALDATTGVFSWTPAAGDVGAPVRVTFTVSDGAASDTLAVRFVVDDGGGTVAKPPVFAAIAPQSVKVGQTLTLTLQATDPNGDAVTFTIQGAAPSGAALNGATFTYTGQASEVGQTFQMTFAASDGTLTAVTTVKISVTSGQVASCVPDANEPNEVVATATALPFGTRTATLCETESTFDIDTYAIVVPAGQELRVTLTFDGAAADLDLALLDANDQFLADSDGVGSTEELRYAPVGEETVYLAVFGYSLEPLTLTYTLETALGEVQVCSDDTYEDNDSPFEATPLDDTAQSASLSICPGDLDYWVFSVTCGARVEVIMDIAGGADLDLDLYDTIDGAGAPIASAFTEEATEYIDVPAAARPGSWLLKVKGYPEASGQGGYQLITDSSGGCQDDAQAGASKAAAKALGTAGGLADLRTCCSDDWYAWSLQANDKVVIDFGVFDAGSLGAIVYGSNGTTQIASKEPSTNGGLMFFSADAAGTYYLKVSGSVGTRYSIDWTVESSTGGCTLMSCDKYDNCNTSNGQCEPDPWCRADSECPPGFACREAYCVNPCQSAFECRPSYACKDFDDTPIATFCGATGPGVTGSDCEAHADCEGTLACLFDTRNGYCAQLGCDACEVGTKCATIAGLSLCAKSCNSNADCREAEGYTCSAEKTCLPQNL